jgi:hypothetical protein
MTWKDQYREKKERSGLTWDEFVTQRLVHVDEIPESELDAIATHLDAVRNEYRDMKREVHDLRVLLDMTDDDDIDP